jgi:hypothetical protein
LIHLVVSSASQRSTTVQPRAANALLQAIHQLVSNAIETQPQATPASLQQQPQQPMGFTGGGMGMLGNFLGGGFGRAMEMGAGIGLGQDLINSIFR